MTEVFKPGPDCMPLDEIERALALPAESPERRAVEQHVASCPHCQTELALLEGFESGAMRDDEREAVEWIAAGLKSPQPKATVVEMPRKRPWRSTGLGVFLAVAATIVIAININWRRPAEITGDGPDVMRSASLRGLAPVGETSNPPDSFQWTAVSGAVRYKLTVTEVDRTVVFETTSIGTYTPVPEALRTMLSNGKTLQWIVAAEDSAGKELAQSGLYRFNTKILQP